MRRRLPLCFALISKSQATSRMFFEAGMEVADRVVVVTGGARGIGSALARRFASAAAETVIVADVDADGAWAVA